MSLTKENKTMARKRMVTRTIVATKATVLCLDTEIAEPCNREVVLSGTFDNDKALLKAARKAIETDDLRVAKVVQAEVITKLYKMDETKFMANADDVVETSEVNEAE